MVMLWLLSPAMSSWSPIARSSTSPLCTHLWKRWELSCPLAAPEQWEQQSTPDINSSAHAAAARLGTGCWQSVCPTTGTDQRQGISSLPLCQYWPWDRVGRVSRPLPGGCKDTVKWNGLLLYLAQISLFESFILSSSGITISTDNINRNSSSLLQPTPFPSIPCANRGRRVNALYSCDLAHLPRTLQCSISKPFAPLW